MHIASATTTARMTLIFMNNNLLDLLNSELWDHWDIYGDKLKWDKDNRRTKLLKKLFSNIKNPIHIIKRMKYSQARFLYWLANGTELQPTKKEIIEQIMFYII